MRRNIVTDLLQIGRTTVIQIGASSNPQVIDPGVADESGKVGTVDATGDLHFYGLFNIDSFGEADFG